MAMMAAAGAMAGGEAWAAGRDPAWSLARVSISRSYYVDMGSARREAGAVEARAMINYHTGGSAEGFKSVLFTAKIECEERMFSAFDFEGAEAPMGGGERKPMPAKVDRGPFGESSPLWSVANLICEPRP